MNNKIDLTNWTRMDTEGQPVSLALKIRDICYIIMVFAGVSLVICAMMKSYIALPSFVFPLLFILALSAAIAAQNAQKKAQKQIPLCSKCQKQMKRYVLPCDPDNIPFYFKDSIEKIIHGKYGHCFALVNHEKHSASTFPGNYWAYELRQVIFGCEKCQQYIVADPYKAKKLNGRGEKAIQKREREIERIRTTMRNLKGKRIVMKKNQSAETTTEDSTQ